MSKWDIPAELEQIDLRSTTYVEGTLDNYFHGTECSIFSVVWCVEVSFNTDPLVKN